MKTKCNNRVSIHALKRKRVLLTFFYTLLFNTVIALFLTALDFGGTFPENLLFSQSIGLSICACVLGAHHLARSAGAALRWTAVIGGIVLGSMAGPFLGALLSGMDPLSIQQKSYYHLFQAVIIGLMFGSIIVYIFYSRERISASESLAQEEKIRRLAAEKRVAETHLRMLQAQIEPHFLFNTLSNILSLLESDPEKGKSMLMDLNRYLRTSLSRTRSEKSTLGQEVEMIRAYLSIFKVRMGDRLTCRVRVPDDLRDAPFPPMLLQPLVENALKHGLEPKIDGGEIEVIASRNGGNLKVVIADTGLGLHEGSSPNTGLTVVRERLEALYKGQGRIILEENRPTGLKVTCEVPHG